MLTDIAVKVIELGIALNSDDFMTLAGISMSLVSIALLIVYYLLQRQIRERRQAEIFLQQQTKRERIVNQIAQHIRQS
jgi:Tfp pilus assembly protein PilN